MAESIAAAAAWAAIVVNRDSAVFLDGCLRSLIGCDRPPAEILVVDNASSDDSLTELAGWPAVQVEASPIDLGYAGAVNRGLERTEAPMVLALRPDVEVAPDLGSALLDAFASQSRLGLVAPLLLAPDGSVRSAGGVLERPLLLALARCHGQREADATATAPVEVDFAPGKALALRRQAVAAAGGLDSRFWPDAYADVDLALRVRAAGWEVRFEPSLRATTLSIEPVLAYQRNRLRLALKHLPATDWAERFLPAELERIRASLLPEAPSWSDTGAEAIEALARAADRSRGRGLLDPAPLLDAVAALQAVAALPTLEVQRRRGRLSDPAVEELVAQQQAVNEAVARALEAQARLNRELVAELLLTLLDVAQLGHEARRSPRSE